MRLRVRFGATAVVLLSSLSLLGGCAATAETKWIRNSSEGLFTKIPATWKTYRIDPYAVDTVRLKPVKRSPNYWELLFDSAPNVKKAKARQHLEADLPKQLVGSLQSWTLPLPDRFGDSRLRERLSIGLMRQFSSFEFNAAPAPDPASVDSVDSADLENLDTNTGTNELAAGPAGDPVEEFNGGNPSIELLTYEEFPNMKKFPGAKNMRGLRIRYNWEIYDDRWVTVDQTILHDPKTNKMYRLVLKCEAACFKKNAKLASEISNSFTLKK
jgi:hypothetical protein